MSTLGNERRVVRVDVVNPQFRDPTVPSTDISTDGRDTPPKYSSGHTFSRGQLVVFSSVSNPGMPTETLDVEFDAKAILELLLRPQNITACGVIAEAFTDTRPAGTLGGRRRLTSAESMRVALPVTFNGIEFIAGDQPHTGFSPGDYVYVMATRSNPDDNDPFTSTRLCRFDELEGLTQADKNALEDHRNLVDGLTRDPVIQALPVTVYPAVYVGIAQTHADAGATSAEILFAPV